MLTLTHVQRLLDDLDKRYPRPWLGRLQISSLYDLREDWPDEYPNADKPGVYFLLNNEKELVYVGKASFSNDIGSRLGKRIGYDSQRRALIRDPQWLSACVRYIATVGLAAEHAFEAAAIEEFIVVNLNPCPILNKVGSGRPRA